MTNRILVLKKIILFFIVIAELFIGFILYKKFFLNKHNFVSVLNKENLVFTKVDDFLYFYDLKPNIIQLDQPEWLEEPAIYTYNNDGFNERFNYEIVKPKDVIRIATLGDSFTFGIYVNTYENWSELLEIELNKDPNICSGKKFEVINLGVSGYDVPYTVKRFKLKGVKYDPDLVIWLESGEGFYRFIELMEPLISHCKNSEDFPREKREEHGFCWNNATETIKKNEGYFSLSNKINYYFDEFFHIYSPQNVVFFGFEKDLHIEEREKAISLRKKMYPQMDLRLIIPDIFKNNEIFPDNHPNLIGHKTIKKVIFDSIKEDIKNICSQ